MIKLVEIIKKFSLPKEQVIYSVYCHYNEFISMIKLVEIIKKFSLPKEQVIYSVYHHYNEFISMN